ncbi:uncharacterized protein LOC120085195 [Benincasa hispida]|uniref:uncharacterized protein LOC120085195 n=1 Tax=Benincasa hispida TaxID=102211 RepID=UPI00190196A3|nr:uncharacterized protein LOC120085195 [Benincasa hispida]XP_038897011.1 uncharacterized protein LOC120085195 [Benincasa hispida]
MEDRQGKRSTKTSIIKGLNASVRPINIQMDNHLVIGGTRHYHQETNCRSPTIVDRYTIMNHYASSTSGCNSFGSRGAGSPLSPLSAIENLETPPVRSPQIYGTPVKVDEEVIVMDGILISSIPGGAKTMRSPLDSGSGGGFSSAKNQYRTDICRYWEDSGSCRFGHKCQFAHGKEDLRPSRIPVRTKPKFSETYGPKFRNSHSLTGIAATTHSNLIDTFNKTELSRREDLTTTTSSTSVRHMNTKPSLIPTISIIDWSPEDDGIKIVVPKTETTKREDVNQYIHGVLYGSTTERTKKRLPVFTQLCSEKLQQE